MTEKSEHARTIKDVQQSVKNSYLKSVEKLSDGKVLKALLREYSKDTKDKTPNVIDMIKFIDDNIPGLLLPIAEENYLLGYTQGLHDAALSVSQGNIGEENVKP